MRSQTLSFALIIFFSFAIFKNSIAAPPQTTYHIKVDQFGYFANARKVAVIADPQLGYNAAESFRAGKGLNQYQVRRWTDDAIVFSGTIRPWKNGLTHTQSGDKGWWFDFSAVTTPGSYYIFDAANNVGSFRFEIADNVYDGVLKQAMRTFYYQRLNFAKEQPFTDAKWADKASFEGASQDRYATSRFAKGDLSTAKDVHGGWMDAGDVNKYTTFALAPVVQLMEAYRINPSVFKDDYNIPESGNGIPDLLDEVKWELDFFKRMQDATGTNGFLLKVGVDNYNEVTPLSLDNRPRYYLPECTSATISGCTMFAVSGAVLKGVPALADYGQELIQRAELAWSRAKLTTSNFTRFDLDCDDGDIKAGDADNSATLQFDNAFAAAVYLYEATGKEEYKAFAEANYTKVYLYNINWWGPFWMPQHFALLRLTTLPGISATICNNIRSQKANMDYQNSITAYNDGVDLYRSHINDDQYSWGHNQYRSNAGHMNLDFITFNINADRHALYKEVAEQYLHWMHGVNPMGMVMLSNMYQYGGEKCVNEIYHTWFRDGSLWDNAQTSPYGPAPGFVTGGPNKDFSGAEPGITNQPYQKAYKDWNSGWPSGAWEITENAIYYQAAYVSLLARLMIPNSAPPVDTEAPTVPGALTVTDVGQNSVALSWTASTDNVGVKGYNVYQDSKLVLENISSTNCSITNLTCGTSYSFVVKSKDGVGNTSGASNTAIATTRNCLVTVATIIYDDAVGFDWQDVSVLANRNFNYTSIVKEGGKSIKVDYSSNGQLSFSNSLQLTATSLTQFRFWVYNNGNNSIKIYTEPFNGTRSSEVVLKPARNRWVEVVVTASQLGNPVSIKKVVIQNNGSTTTTMYFDGIQLTGMSEAVAPLALEGSPSESTRLQNTFDYRIFPNPARELLTLECQSATAGSAVLQLIGNTGKIVQQQVVPVHKGYNQWRINLNRVVAGVYYLRIVRDKIVQTRKVAIQ